MRMPAAMARVLRRARRVGGRCRPRRRAPSAVVRWTPTATCAPAPTVTAARAPDRRVRPRCCVELLDGQLVVLGRIMPASNHTFLTRLGRHGRPVRLQAELGGAAAVGLHRRHPRGPGVRRLGGLRPPRLGRRAPDGAARRSRRARHGAAVDGARGGATSARTRSTSCPRGRCRPASCTSLDASGPDDEPVIAGARGLRAAAPDGRLRPRHQQHRPQGRPRAADGRTVTATASTTGSASTPRTSCARCSGAGPGSRSPPEEPRVSSRVLDGLRRRPARARWRTCSPCARWTRSPGGASGCSQGAPVPDAARAAGRRSRGPRSEGGR